MSSKISKRQAQDKLERKAYKDNEKDPIHFVGRGYTIYRNLRTGKFYEIGDKIASRQDRKLKEEEIYGEWD